MSKTVGFIGGGNMGRNIMKGLLEKGLYTAENITVFDAFTPVMDQLKKDLGINTCRDVHHLVQSADIILLAVKPQVMDDVLAAIKEDVTPEKTIISIAAGIKMEKLEAGLGKDKKIARVMPNANAMVLEAMSGVVCSDNMDYEEKMEVIRLFKAMGRAELISEYLMDAVVGISGSSPAYVYMFIEALASGAAAEGMPKSQAYIFAAQAVLGSAKMVMYSGMHPGELIDMVCSPGGTTLEALNVLEHNGFKATVADAVRAAAQKNRELK